MSKARMQQSLIMIVLILVLSIGLVLTGNIGAQTIAQEQTIIDVYRNVSPGVVNITSRVITQDSFRNDVPQQGSGSGFVIDKEGHIVTNNHVVEGAERVEVTFSDETVVTAKVIGTDPSVDLAIIKVDVPQEKLFPLTLGSSGDLLPGQLAIAIGNPFGLERTITTGVVSALDRSIQARNGRLIGGVVQTDAAINPGNSGGPLMDSKGMVIGVNTAIFSPSGGSVGVGFAIPVDTVKRVVPELITKGRYAHPWLGISGFSLSGELAKRLEDVGSDLGRRNGVMIIEVVKESPAEQAGLKGGDREVQLGNRLLTFGGDIITGIDSKVIKDMEDLINHLELETSVGQSVKLKIIRDGQEKILDLTLGERPSMTEEG